MTTLYRVFDTTAELSTSERALWTAYHDAECAARGLPRGSSLDTRLGRPVPAITTRYADPVTVSGRTGGVLPLDTRAQAVAPAMVAGSVEYEELPEHYRTAVAPDDTTARTTTTTTTRTR